MIYSYIYTSAQQLDLELESTFNGPRQCRLIYQFFPNERTVPDQEHTKAVDNRQRPVQNGVMFEECDNLPSVFSGQILASRSDSSELHSADTPSGNVQGVFGDHRRQMGNSSALWWYMGHLWEGKKGDAQDL